MQMVGMSYSVIRYSSAGIACNPFEGYMFRACYDRAEGSPRRRMGGCLSVATSIRLTQLKFEFMSLAQIP